MRLDKDWTDSIVTIYEGLGLDPDPLPDSNPPGLRKISSTHFLTEVAYPSGQRGSYRM